MKRRILFVVSVIVLSSTLAFAGQPFGNNWGKWGVDDQLGTLNYITPQKIVEASKLVKSGKVINVAIDLKADMPGLSWLSVVRAGCSGHRECLHIGLSA